jgi:3-oxoacyl-[acyl-carrier-protein] synthase-3
MARCRPFQLLGTGAYLPERVLTNAELERMVDTTDAWIRERTGIAERRIAADHESTSDLAAAAIRAACSDAAIEPGELDAIIVATSTPDTVFPSTACWVQERLGARGMPAFDVSAGCSGWLYGLELAASLLQGGQVRRVAVVGAEVMSRVIDWTDRTTCVLFGDGAGAAVLGRAEDERTGMLGSNWGADGTLAKLLYQPAGGSQRPATAATVEARLHTVHMEGRSIFKHAVTSMSDAAKAALAQAELGPDAIDLLIPHQANMRIIEAVRARAEISPERLHLVLEPYGNMSAATIPVGLHDARARGRIGPGSTVLFTAFGAGLTWAASVVRL